MDSKTEFNWWEFPVTADFIHSESGTKLMLERYWTGSCSYSVRFAGPLSGTWNYETRSSDPGLDGQRGTAEVAVHGAAEVEENPNLRGQIRIAPDGRTFEYAGGTPFFLLANTFWAANTARAGLGEQQDEPFFQYLDDRKRKNFSAVLLQMFHGFGDYPNDPTGHRNEGGHLFVERDFSRLNPKFLDYADRRCNALWKDGWVIASPVCWWGKTRTFRFDPDEVQRLASYLAVHYGPCNTRWAVSGEYQCVIERCGWTEEDLTRIGEAMQRHNPYRRPLSIHPSGRTNWPVPHGSQSSRPFNEAGWLDHRWLRAGQSLDRLHWLVSRPAENRALQPIRPVFCSEAYYERAEDSEGAYHSRWQAWTAFLNGCAGYGYGAMGVWQFYDPDDPGGEQGKQTPGVVPWQEALAFAGSGQVGHVRSVLGEVDWPRLVPAPELVKVDSEANTAVIAGNISVPQLARIPGEAWVLYVPRDDAGKVIELAGIENGMWLAQWVDPRLGQPGERVVLEVAEGRCETPARPEPAEDWVLIVRQSATPRPGLPQLQ